MTSLPSTLPVPVRLSRLRRTIGRRLRESVTTKPPVTLHTTAPAGALLNAVEAAREGGARTNVTAFVAEATVRVLGAHPTLNAHVTEDEVTTFDAVHLGVAVDTPAGLIVPVVRDAQLLDAGEIGLAIAALAERARAGQLVPEEVLDATFTLSTLGAYGIEQFTPIINPPQIAVLGLGALRTVPALLDGQWVEQPIIHLSLTFDHAAVDGAPAARFLAALVERIGAPAQTLKESS